MSDIFISYAKQDRERAARLATALAEIGGWSVWWDRNIPIGQAFDQIILKELTNARCIIVLWSSKALKSSWVIEEALFGRERDKLLPVFLEEVEPPFGFRRIQAANFISWNGSYASVEFKELCIVIRSILEMSDKISHSKPLRESSDVHSFASSPHPREATLIWLRPILCVVVQLTLGFIVAVIWFFGLGDGIAEGLLDTALLDGAEDWQIHALIMELKSRLAGVGLGYMLAGCIAGLLWLGYGLRWGTTDPQQVRSAATIWWLCLLLALVGGLGWGFWHAPTAGATMVHDLSLTLPILLLPLAALFYWPVSTLFFTRPRLKSVVPFASHVI